METTDFAALEAFMENRAHLYNLLARIFRVEVDQELLDELMAIHYPQNTGNDDVDASYRAIHAFLCKARENTLDALAIDYARIFLGSGSLDARAAFPFESVYTSDKGLTMQDARDEVLAIYRSWGIDKSMSWKEGEDHLAVELEFVKLLALRTVATLRTGNEEKAANLIETQRNFLVDHVLRWIRPFVEDVHTYARRTFYPAFADLLLAYITEDVALLDELLATDDADSEAGEEA